jgi:hypothetical protein
MALDATLSRWGIMTPRLLAQLQAFREADQHGAGAHHLSIHRSQRSIQSVQASQPLGKFNSPPAQVHLPLVQVNSPSVQVNSQMVETRLLAQLQPLREGGQHGAHHLSIHRSHRSIHRS